MKHVTFTRMMSPHQPGERRILPDDVAARLEREGVIAPHPPSWPEGAEAAPSDSEKQKYRHKRSF